MFGDPANRFPLNYVQNLVDALHLVAKLDRPGLQQFNLVDDDELTLAQYHQAKTLVDGTRPLYFAGRSVLFAASVSDAARRLFPREGSALSTHQVKRALQNRLYVSHHIREEAGWAPRVSPLDRAASIARAYFNDKIICQCRRFEFFSPRGPGSWELDLPRAESAASRLNFFSRPEDSGP